jgi:preprotein translocase subunit SecF
MLDIEFASGTSVQFKLKDPMPIEDVRKLIADIGEATVPSASVVAVRQAGEAENITYEVVTPNPTALWLRPRL